VVTLGGALVGLPLVLLTSLVDMALNFVLTMLGAWVYPRFRGRRLWGVSCALLGVMGICLCLVAVLGAAALAAGGVGLLRRTPTPAFPSP